MRAKRVLRAVATTVVLAAAIAGCGSSSSGGAGKSGGSGGSGSSTGSGGGQIVVGNIGSYSSPSGVTFAGGPKVLKAWAQQVNASGGIDGKKVKLVVADDGGSPTKGLTLAKQLVQQDHVVAIIGDLTDTSSVWYKYMQTANVPVLGGNPYVLPAVVSPMWFPIGTNFVAQRYALVAEAKHYGNGKYADLYCAEAPTCANGVPIEKTLSKSLGVSVPIAQSFSGSLTDYTPQCQAIKSSGVGAWTLNSASPVDIKVDEQCKSLGVTAKLIETGGEADSAWLGNPKLNGTLNVELAAPYFDSSSPGGKGYNALVKKYLPNFGTENGAAPQYAYIGAKLFQAAVAASGTSDVTSASVLKGLYSLKDETLGGLTSPLNFVKGKPTENNCWFLSAIEGGKWATPQGLKYQCAPAKVIDPEIARVVTAG